MRSWMWEEIEDDNGGDATYRLCCGHGHAWRLRIGREEYEWIPKQRQVQCLVTCLSTSPRMEEEIC